MKVRSKKRWQVQERYFARTYDGFDEQNLYWKPGDEIRGEAETGSRNRNITCQEEEKERPSFLLYITDAHGPHFALSFY